MPISEGDDVLFIGPRGKSWMAKIRRGAALHTHVGVIKHDDIIGMEYGSAVVTPQGAAVHLMRPFLEDYMMRGERLTQIVYPKDMGLIATRTGMGLGSRVLEIGTGSGALTMFLATVVAPSGRVYSYEARPEFAEMASRNLARAGLLDYVDIKVRDASGGVDEEAVDTAIVDVGDPTSVLGAVRNALRPAGGLAIIAPTFNQVERAVAALRDGGFIMVDAFETSYRRIESKPGATRPSSTTISHTTFVVTARRATPPPPPPQG